MRIKKLYLLGLGFLLSLSLWGQNQQRLGYIDSEYIFEQIPEYAEAKEKLEQLAENWQQQLEQMWAEIEKLKAAYAADKIFLTAEMRQERLALIEEKERAAQLFKQQRFGLEGELVKRQRELLAPIEAHFLETLQKIIEQEKYAFIFDVAKQNGIFTNTSKNNKLNLNEYVLKKMGYVLRKK